jgi:hypothetical protein
MNWVDVVTWALLTASVILMVGSAFIWAVRS